MEVFRQITANNILITSYPFIKELAMEAYLMENEDILMLDNDEYNDVQVVDAEIALKGGGVSGRNGRLDLLALYSNECFGIVELKIGEVNSQTLRQLESYLEQKEQIIDRFGKDIAEPRWVGMVIGDSISRDLQEKIESGLEYKGIPIAAKTIKRFRADTGEILVITDTYFKNSNNSKNTDKLIFKGEKYRKGRLVHAVIKDYSDNNSNISYADLEKEFPGKLQGTKHGCFKSYIEATTNIINGRKRHYIKPQELIALNDEKIAVCSQWGIGNIGAFITNAERLGYKISWDK